MRVRALAMLLACTIPVALAGCGSSGGSSANASGGTINLKFSTFVNEQTVVGQTFDWWADQVEKQTNGQVKIQKYFSASLVPAADTLQAMSDGQIDLGPATEIYSPAQLPLTQVAGIPFATNDPEAMMRTLDDLYADNQDFQSQYTKAGVHVLFFLPIGTSTISADKPITSLADLQGLKIRAGGQAAVALQAVGAVPQNIDISAVYDAIQRGTVDGISTLPLDTLVGTSLQEVAPYILNDGTGEFASSAQSISLQTWNSLPANVQQVMTQVSAEATDEGIKLLTQANEAACAKLAQTKGVVVSAMPADQDAQWKSELGDTVVNSWMKAAAAGGYSSDQINAFYAAYKAKLAQYDGKGTYDEDSALCK